MRLVFANEDPVEVDDALALRHMKLVEETCEAADVVELENLVPPSRLADVGKLEILVPHSRLATVRVVDFLTHYGDWHDIALPITPDVFEHIRFACFRSIPLREAIDAMLVAFFLMSDVAADVTRACVAARVADVPVPAREPVPIPRVDPPALAPYVRAPWRDRHALARVLKIKDWAAAHDLALARSGVVDWWVSIPTKCTAPLQLLEALHAACPLPPIASYIRRLHARMVDDVSKRWLVGVAHAHIQNKLADALDDIADIGATLRPALSDDAPVPFDVATATLAQIKDIDARVAIGTNVAEAALQAACSLETPVPADVVAWLARARGEGHAHYTIANPETARVIAACFPGKVQSVSLKITPESQLLVWRALVESGANDPNDMISYCNASSILEHVPQPDRFQFGIRLVKLATSLGANPNVLSYGKCALGNLLIEYRRDLVPLAGVIAELARRTDVNPIAGPAYEQHVRIPTEVRDEMKRERIARQMRIAGVPIDAVPALDPYLPGGKRTKFEAVGVVKV